MRAGKENGFSLIELLIVVAIILIIAAIAIPNLLQARISANESSAASSVRQITIAEFAYFNAYPTIGYASQLTDLGGIAPCTPAPTAACVLDDFLAHATPGSTGKSGYQFLATGAAAGGSVNTVFAAGGTPLSIGQSGNRNFCSTNDGALRAQYGVGGTPVTTVGACLAYPVAQ